MRIPAKDLLTRLEGGVIRTLFDLCKDDPLAHRTKVHNPKHSNPNNQAYKQDSLLQSSFESLVDGLEANYGCKILVLGEEKGSYPDARSIASHEGYIAFVDAIDGTDLMARGFSNFCFSFLLFEPQKQRVILSVVGHSSGIIYWADEDGAFRKNAFGNVSELTISAMSTSNFENASVCFYGQKPRYLMNAMRSKSLSERLAELEQRMKGGEKLGIRIYNFAGNPMMVRIPEGAVDVIFEITGQEIHDVAPGAFIARKAGAILLDLDGQEINLERALLDPQRRLKYVLASNRSLADEVLNLLKDVGNAEALHAPRRPVSSIATQSPLL